MLTHILKISLRILFKYRLYTVISLLGLTIAISSSWFIADYVRKSNQYDEFHEKADRIYRVTMEVTAGGNTDHYATTGKPVGRLLHQNYPAISSYAKIRSLGNTGVRIAGKLFDEKGFYTANPEALDVFTFDFISGDKTTCFSSPNTVLLARSLAEKYYNGTEILDEQILIDQKTYSIKGVFEDWPGNSHLDLTGLVYNETEGGGYDPQDWFDLDQYNYVLTGSELTQNDMDHILDQLATEHITPTLEGSGMAVKFYSQPLDNLYFESGLIDDVPKGNSKYVSVLAIAGLFVFLISGLNYVNLSLTQSTRRSKERGIKKVLGITRKQLLIQEGMESFIFTLLVMILSGVLILSFDNLYFQITGYSARVLIGNSTFIVGIILIVFLFGLFSAKFSNQYPSLPGISVHSGVKSVHSFKKLLLGIQFATASIIIIATLTIFKQIHFIRTKDLGFSKEQIMIVNLPGNDDLKEEKIQLRERIRNLVTIQNTSVVGGGALPGEENGKEVFEVTVDGSRVEKVFNIYRIDEQYCKLLDIEFVLGRDFDPARPNDKTTAVIVNESLSNSVNWENPLEQSVWYDNQPRKVIGVVRNFHNQSLHNAIEPIVFLFDENYASNLLVRAPISQVGIIERAWSTIFPATPFRLTYFDQFIDVMYKREADLVKLLGFFSIVSIVLCCMGLFAVFSMQVIQKTKELSIRKILGAGSLNLMKSLTADYFVFTLLAIGIAVPIGWVLMNNWLNSFHFRIQLEPVIFVFSTSIVLVMGCITLLYHIIKVLRVNPVDTLKNE